MAKKQAKKAQTKEIEMLLVKSKVREYVKELGEYNIAQDFLEALNTEVVDLIKKASQRTSHNKRKTLSARDV